MYLIHYLEEEMDNIYILIGLVILTIMTYVIEKYFNKQEEQTEKVVDKEKNSYHRWSKYDMHLLDQEDLTDKDIAALLGVTEHSVRSKRKRIKRRINECI